MRRKIQLETSNGTHQSDVRDVPAEGPFWTVDESICDRGIRFLYKNHRSIHEANAMRRSKVLFIVEHYKEPFTPNRMRHGEE